jgi:antitoxin component YwqK of YwqJK toxin-antitoxin module
MVTLKPIQKLVLALLALIVLMSNSCSPDRTWVDRSLATSDKGEFYVEKFGFDNEAYLAGIFRPDGTKLADAHFLDSTLETKHGSFIFYWPNGRVESMGYYSIGLKDGVWRRFDSSGKEIQVRVYKSKAVRPFME